MKRQATTTQFFYQNGKLATVNQGGQKRAIFRSADMPLAELSAGERQETGLLEVDQNGSVLKVSGDADDEERHAYSVYGHDPSLPSQRTMAGFNGEHIEAVAAGYLLGNGYRLFNPALMRFHSADSLSPFGIGGLNAYSYCQGDPINFKDPSGHTLQRLLISLGLRKRRAGVAELIKSTSNISKHLVNRDYNLPSYKAALREFSYDGVPSPEYTTLPTEGQSVITEPTFEGIPINISSGALSSKIRAVDRRLENLKSELEGLKLEQPGSAQLAGTHIKEIEALETMERMLIIRSERLNLNR
ncbi:RHS repeat-associated core domain-containing protein [Pseudomonas sp. NY15463]|uniref:RHS repeat-associated core domain-containing protein n=1 Tax=Pseudomonas sp. NY15463 TaxID=3400361 RepID=UPI003A8C1014